MNWILSRASGCLLVLLGAAWILIWSGFALVMDCALMISVSEQIQALYFSSAPGVITESRVRLVNVGEDDAEDAVVRYDYVVGKSKFHGTRIRFGSYDPSPWDARQLVARFPVGKKVTVWYDPEEPNECLLLPGLTAGHAHFALFALPFNVVALASWSFAFNRVFRSNESRLPSSAKLRQTHHGFVLRIYGLTPLQAATAGVAITSIIGVLASAFASAFLPVALPVLFAWIAVICVPPWLYVRQRKQARVLTVNEALQTYELSDVPRRRRTIGGTLGSLGNIVVRERVKIDSDRQKVQSYGVALTCAASICPRHRFLAVGMDRDSALRLSAWLGDRLKLGVESPFA